MFHVNPLPSRGFTRNIEHYFIRKNIQDCRLLQGEESQSTVQHFKHQNENS